MKRFFQKIISKALVLSVTFHIFLAVGLSLLYRERVARPQGHISAISISENRERLPVRRLKRPRMSRCNYRLPLRHRHGFR